MNRQQKSFPGENFPSNPGTMINAKLVLLFGLALCGIFFGCAAGKPSADKPGGNAAISPKAGQIVRQMSDYYQGLESFAGTNLITDTSPASQTPLVSLKQFAFRQPNQFRICSENTNDSWLFCDGANRWEYRPYYYNGYTKTPAPTHYAQAVTNWVAGELVHLIVNPDRCHEIMGGFGLGLTGLSEEDQSVDGIACHHLSLTLPGGRTDELWVAQGTSPFIVKYAARWPNEKIAGQFYEHTEMVLGWQANLPIPPEHFIFIPPVGANRLPSWDCQVESRFDAKTGATKYRFYTLKDEAERLAQPETAMVIAGPPPPDVSNALAQVVLSVMPGHRVMSLGATDEMRVSLANICTNSISYPVPGLTIYLTNTLGQGYTLLEPPKLSVKNFGLEIRGPAISFVPLAAGKTNQWFFPILLDTNVVPGNYQVVAHQVIIKTGTPFGRNLAASASVKITK